MNIIVTADIEVHTKNGDVSTSEIRNVFSSDDNIAAILNWINKETDRLVNWINGSLGTLEAIDTNNGSYVTGTYAIKKNVTISPIEE